MLKGRMCGEPCARRHVREILLPEPPMRSLAVAIALVLSGLVFPRYVQGSPAPRCSLTPGFHPGHGERLVLLLARPLTDTVHAGPGDMELGEGAGHAGNGQRIRIYGQRF